MPNDFRVEQRTNLLGETVWGRKGYAGNESHYNMCDHCKIPEDGPEGCPIRRELDKIERIHRVTVPVWECPAFLKGRTML